MQQRRRRLHAPAAPSSRRLRRHLGSSDDATEAEGDPCHLAFNPNDHHAYVNLELASRLAD